MQASAMMAISPVCQPEGWRYPIISATCIVELDITPKPPSTRNLACTLFIA